MVVHYTRLLTACLLVLSVVVPVHAQLRSPWGPRPFDDDEQPRRHSIVTVWADALESLSHPNPLLRWHAARLSARHTLAFDDDELTRAWMRERDLRVRVALKRTLIQRGKGDDLVRLSSTNPSSCSQVSTLVRTNEARPVAELLLLLEDAKHAEDRTYLTFELALALRQLRNANSRTAGLHALRAHAQPEHMMILRGVARDEAVTEELVHMLASEEPGSRQEAVNALVALDNAHHETTFQNLLQTESHPDVVHALLKALRRSGIPISQPTLVEVQQRVQRFAREQAEDAVLDLVGYQVELTRAMLAVTRAHEELHGQAQRNIRDWLLPTSPLAGLAIHLLGQLRTVPLFTVAPYVDDPRSYVRETAVRVITHRLSAKHPLRQWLSLEAIDSRAFERLQPKWKPTKPGPAVPVLLQSSEPILVAWENGHELADPPPSGVLFEPYAPLDAAFCHPERTWLSLEEQIRDL